MNSARHAPSGLQPLSLWHLSYLCDAMRPDEVEQYLELTGATRFDPEVAAVGFFQTPGPRFTLVADGFPVICGGWAPLLPGTFQSWMVGTLGGWERHWRAITRASRWSMEHLFDQGARRLQTIALASRTRTLEWYERGLKMKRQGGDYVGYGATGATAVCYYRLHPDWEAEHGQANF